MKLPPAPPNAVRGLAERSAGEKIESRRVAVHPNTNGPRIDYSQVDPKVLNAAQGMEAMFLDYLMKVMRDTVPKNDMDMENPATGIYRSMLDSEVAQTASRTGGVGLAEQIIAYLEPSRYTGPKGAYPVQGQGNAPTQGARLNRTGGTDEGR